MSLILFGILTDQIDRSFVVLKDIDLFKKPDFSKLNYSHLTEGLGREPMHRPVLVARDSTTG